MVHPRSQKEDGVKQCHVHTVKETERAVTSVVASYAEHRICKHNVPVDYILHAECTQ